MFSVSTTKAVKPLTTTLSMVTNVSKSTTVFPKKCLLDKNNIENYILSEKQVRREYFAGESVFVECKKGYYLKRKSLKIFKPAMFIVKTLSNK